MLLNAEIKQRNSNYVMLTLTPLVPPHLSPPPQKTLPGILVDMAISTPSHPVLATLPPLAGYRRQPLHRRMRGFRPTVVGFLFIKCF